MNTDNMQPVETLKGIGEKTAKLFEKVGVRTVDDLLHYYPRGYDTFEEPKPMGALEDGMVMAVDGCLKNGASGHHFGSASMVTASISDMTGKLRLVWYHMPYLKNTLKPGSRYIFRGKVSRKKNGLVMEQPQMYRPEVYEALLKRMQPVYGKTKGLSNKTITSAMEQALSLRVMEKDYLPAGLRVSNELAEYNFAIEHIHFPEDQADLMAARKRLVYDEFFLFLLAVRRLKESREDLKSSFIFEKDTESRRLEAALPYALTEAQKRTLSQVYADLKSGKVMNRLIQGDVGSGKTIIAVLALVSAAENGFQGALMAPTEVLAKQHYETVEAMFRKYDVPFCAVLVTGSMTAKEKRLAYEKIASHEADIIIGTHALIQEKVVYDRLALVITDEQHRFGVAQRAALAAKGAAPQSSSPHVLVMSATPIPRTLALIIYGDLDVSVIDQLPPGRVPVQTFVVGESKRQRMYNFVRKQAGEGRQTYIVCPAVEESTGDGAPPGLMDLKAVKVYARQLQEQVFPQLRVGLLYGKMKPREKEAVMSAFARGELQVLVSTTVIEVGVDVPNAALMIVENAERFGLSQLHQLRGRVGRGRHQSYCVLLTSNRSPDTLARLRVFASTTDGFKISEEDLKLRGPGDFFGRRQHGLPTLRLADLSGDMRLLSEAQQAARDLLSADPRLALGENRPVLERVRALFSDTPDIFN